MIHSFVLNFDANTEKPVITASSAFSICLTCQIWQLQLTGLTCQVVRLSVIDLPTFIYPFIFLSSLQLLKFPIQPCTPQTVKRTLRNEYPNAISKNMTNIFKMLFFKELCDFFA